MKKISILMATYNPNVAFLRESLNSIQAQTFNDFELVMVDDGTTNCDLEKIFSEYSFNYKIIKNVHNLGLPTALNIGLNECQGEYIARMDDDDVMHPQRLEKQLAFIQKHPGVVFCKANRVDLNGKKLDNLVIKTDIVTYLKKSGNCLTHSSLFVKKSILTEIGGYNCKFTYAQDYELYMRLIDKYKFYQISEKLITYRVPSNLSLTKKILSPLFCYAASVMYFSNNKSFKNTLYFFRRSLGLTKLMYLLIRRQ